MDDPAPQKLRATFNMPAFTGMLRVAYISLGSELRDGLTVAAKDDVLNVTDWYF
jgi:hypothetical protein